MEPRGELGMGALMSDQDLVIRPFRPGDERDVNRGFNEVFSCDRPLEEWSWKFPVEPDGRFIMLAELDGRVVAQYAGLPVQFRIDDAQWTATQIVDVFATRAARGPLGRKGIWVRTVDEYFDVFGRSGRAPLLFGFPGRRHRRLGILQLGYDSMDPQPINYLVRRSPGPSAVGRRLLYRAELGRDWEPRLDSLWRRVRHQYPVAIVRDARHALRRFAGHPAVRYHRFLIFPRLSSEPVAFAVFRSDDDRVRWADLVWDHSHPGALDLLVHLSGRLAAQTGCESEELWLNGDEVGQARLIRRGFGVAPEPDDLVMVARAFDPAVDLVAVAQGVYLTMGDSDLV